MVFLLMNDIIRIVMAITKPEVYDKNTTTSMKMEIESGSCFQSGQVGTHELKNSGSRKKSSWQFKSVGITDPDSIK